MDGALISALAALGGSLVGSMAPVFANYVVQKGLTQRELLNHEISLREALYTEFIRDAAPLFAKSLSSKMENLDDLVAIYTLVSRLRLVASDPVLSAAENLVRTISRQYREPNLTFAEIDAAANSGKVDPLGEFSSACRHELRNIMRLSSKSVKFRRGQV